MPHSRWSVLLVGAGAILALAGQARGADLQAPPPTGRAGVVRILHFGDSHLASASSRQTYRWFFQAQYGDGGPGLGLPWAGPMPGVTAQASPGWIRGRKAGGDGCAGLSGAYLETRRAGEVAACDAAFARCRLVFLRDAGGGTVAVRLDGQLLGEYDLRAGTGPVTVVERTRPAGGRSRLEIRTTAPGRVRILDLALETGSGAVYSPLAFDGARADWLRRMPEQLFRAQVEAAAPDVVALAFGTNEANARDFDPGLYRRELEALVARFRRAAPRAALVLIGPPDGRLGRGSAATLGGVIAVQKVVAQALDLPFLDQQKAMGGLGAMADWARAGLANGDGVHLRPLGYQKLARRVIQAWYPGAGADPGPAVPGPSAALAARPRGLAAPAPAARPLYSFRNEAGGVFITDDPSNVDELPGKWVQVFP